MHDMTKLVEVGDHFVVLEERRPVLSRFREVGHLQGRGT